MNKQELRKIKKLRHMYFKQLKAGLIDYETYIKKLKELNY
jgi:uncharacterized short protein YbdD (DUF466 family)